MMTIDLFIALTGFAFVTTVTPGPNNMMLLASGANYGIRRTLPHMIGISFGVAIMLVIVGMGLIQLFDAYPVTLTVMKWGSVAYLLYLAWKIANAAPKSPEAPDVAGKPFTALQAAAFQWVNPKAWFMALTAISVYAGDQTVWQIAIVAAVFLAVSFPSISVWVVLGHQAQRFLQSPTRIRWFNITMAVLLVLTLIPIFDH